MPLKQARHSQDDSEIKTKHTDEPRKDLHTKVKKWKAKDFWRLQW